MYYFANYYSDIGVDIISRGVGMFFLRGGGG